ncbi:MarR family winged helix-turn-helix transcriptional regulator [Rhodococcus sp. NPDC003322]
MPKADVGRLTGIDRSDVTAGLDVLCTAGCATRTPDPADGRRKIVSLTERGRARLERLDVVLDGVQSEFLAPLAPTEQRVFLELLGRMVPDR